MTLVTALVFYVPTIHFSLMYERLGVRSSAWIGVLITLGTVGSIAAGYVFGRRPARPALESRAGVLWLRRQPGGSAWRDHYLAGLACCMVANFAFGLTLPTLVGWTLDVLPPAWRGRGMGLWMSVLLLRAVSQPAAVRVADARRRWPRAGTARSRQPVRAARGRGLPHPSPSTRRESSNVKFGIANAIRNHPAQGLPLADVYRDYIGDAVLAEQLGFSFSWYGEHRMTPCQWTPSPLTVCAWVAAKTTTMRVGPQVLCLPFHNPLRVAEDVAVIDIMSNGRFDFGIGVGSQYEEFRTFGINPDERVGRTWEAIE